MMYLFEGDNPMDIVYTAIRGAFAFLSNLDDYWFGADSFWILLVSIFVLGTVIILITGDSGFDDYD